MNTGPDLSFRRSTPPPCAPTQLALYGRDEILLRYRNQVLCWAGFTTSLILAPSNEVCAAPVTVFCHTLTTGDRAATYRRLQQQNLSSKLVVMNSPSRPVHDRLPYDAVVESLAGPNALILAIRNLLSPP